jgi:2-amino-4-hydroxy-6-hydroxymethyldihydropteridine diphosphokinase
MSLIIATGSNLGDSLEILTEVQKRLDLTFGLIAASRVYQSKAVEYLNQPDFFNQVLEFSLPTMKPIEVMVHLLQLEKEFGRNRNIPKGPRTLDLDIIFWGFLTLDDAGLTIPHPRWAERSFVVRPLQELPFFKSIEKCFTIPNTFDVDASPIL